MQNTYSTFIVRLKNDSLICFYYIRESGILYRIYEGGKWSDANTLIKSGRPNYTVTLDDNGKMYVLCQNNYGDVLLYLNQDGMHTNWTEKTILKNKGQRVHPITLHPIISERGMGLIYNVPIVDEKSSHLIRQTFNARGQWSPAARVDKLIALPGRMFQVQAVTPRHVLVFYQIMNPKGYEYNLGYREMTPASQSRFNIFHSTSSTIADVSFLTTDDSIHVLYIVRSMYSSQLIYRKKEEGEFSNPVVLYEGESLENCLMFFADGNLHVTYKSDDQLFHCLSENSDNGFSRPVRYYSKVCEDPVKASYIGGCPEGCCIREVYVDSAAPWDIQVIPDICKDFYPPEPLKNEPLPEKAAEPTPACPIEIDELKKAIYRLKKELEEKDRAIMSLNSLVAMKSEELSQLDFLRKESQRKLSERIAELEGALEGEQSLQGVDILRR